MGSFLLFNKLKSLCVAVFWAMCYLTCTQVMLRYQQCSFQRSSLLHPSLAACSDIIYIPLSRKMVNVSM